MDFFDFEQLHVRPRFSFEIPHAPDKIEEHLKKAFKAPGHKFIGKVVNKYVILDIPQHLDHFWSPRISFEIEVIKGEENKSLIRGLIGPKPQVWTMFMFIYFSIGIMGLFASLYGLSKQTLGESSLFVWGFPVALVIMSTAYLASKSGEKIGAEQISLLKDFFRAAFKAIP